MPAGYLHLKSLIEEKKKSFLVFWIKPGLYYFVSISRRLRFRAMTRFIINADDFGQNEEVNEGIIKYLNEGFLTSASLLVNGAGFEQAIGFVKTHNNFSAGIHLNLSDWKPVTRDLKSISTLINKDGCFIGPKGFRRKCLIFLVSYKQVYIELENQILKFISYGVRPSHIDSHYHIHTIPLVAVAVKNLAEKYGIHRIRLSFDYPAGSKIYRHNRFLFLLKLPYKKLLNGYFKRHFKTYDYFLGDFFKNGVSPKFIDGLSGKLCESSWHLPVNWREKAVACAIDKQRLLVLNNPEATLISFNGV